MKIAWMLLVMLFTAAATWLFLVGQRREAGIHQTSGDVFCLQHGIEMYWDDHNKVPSFTAPEVVMEGPEGRAFLLELLGDKPTASPGGSVRRISYIDPEPGGIKSKGGLIYEKPAEMQGPLGFYDAWGQPFHVVIDDDYNGGIPDPLTPGHIIRGKIAIVYSYGPDKKTGGGDDIKSW